MVNNSFWCSFVSAWISSWHLKFNKLNWAYLHSSPLCTPNPSTLNFTKLNPSFILSIIQAWNFGGFLFTSLFPLLLIFGNQLLSWFILCGVDLYCSWYLLITPFLSSYSVTTLVVFGIEDLQGPSQPRKFVILPQFLITSLLQWLSSWELLYSLLHMHTSARWLFFKCHFVMSTPPQKSFVSPYCHSSNFLTWHSKPLCIRAWAALPLFLLLSIWILFHPDRSIHRSLTFWPLFTHSPK